MRVVRVGGDGEDGCVECLEVVVVLTERVNLGRANEGEIEWTAQSAHAATTQDISSNRARERVEV